MLFLFIRILFAMLGIIDFFLFLYLQSKLLLCRKIGKILGLDKQTPMILLGAGNLGKAIATHIDFHNKGFDLIGASVHSPEEAIAWTEYVRQRGPVEIPVYKEDGETIVDYFVIGAGVAAEG